MTTTLSMPASLDLEASARAADAVARMPGIDLFDYLADYTGHEPTTPEEFTEESMRALVLEDAASVGAAVFLARVCPADD